MVLAESQAREGVGTDTAAVGFLLGVLHGVDLQAVHGGDLHVANSALHSSFSFCLLSTIASFRLNFWKTIRGF